MILCLALTVSFVVFAFAFLIVLFPIMFTVGILARRFFPPKLIVFKNPDSLFG